MKSHMISLSPWTLRATKLLFPASLIALIAACSPSEYLGLPGSAVPQPTPISEITQAEAAEAVRTLQVMASGEPALMTQSQASSLLIVLEASAEDRQALRILRDQASEFPD